MQGLVNWTSFPSSPPASRDLARPQLVLVFASHGQFARARRRLCACADAGSVSTAPPWSLRGAVRVKAPRGGSISLRGPQASSQPTPGTRSPPNWTQIESTTFEVISGTRFGAKRPGTQRETQLGPDSFGVLIKSLRGELRRRRGVGDKSEGCQ